MLVWNKAEERYYHDGIDRGVLYPSGAPAATWNGISSMDEDSAGTASLYYIDGQIFYADVEPGDFKGKLTTYNWPDAFSTCIGIPEIADGFYADGQKPKRFGLSYRSLIGNGTEGDLFGYQIHLLYNALATIGTRSRKTLSDKSEPMDFTFDLVATPVHIQGFRPTAHYVIDTRHLEPALLAALEDILYGGTVAARLPDPTELYEMLNFGSAITFVDHGDDTWTARGAYANVHPTGLDTWEILNVNGTDNGDDSYTLEDTL